MSTGSTGDEEKGTAVHRALADARRARIVEELRGSPDGLDAREIAARVGLHQNTVRWHLGVLGDAGLVVSRPGALPGPGRPRIVFAVRPDPVEQGRNGYRLLATMLAGSLSLLPDGPDRAESTGDAWGRYLVKRPLPLTRLADDQAAAEVVAVLDEQGFEPELDDRDIRMRRC